MLTVITLFYNSLFCEMTSLKKSMFVVLTHGDLNNRRVLTTVLILVKS